MLAPRKTFVIGSSKSGSKQMLEKKIPENPKYKHIKPVVDSGASIRKYLEKVKEAQKNTNYKKEEIFKRIKLLTFVKLVIEVSQELAGNKDTEANDEDLSRLDKSREDSTAKAIRASTKRCEASAINSVIFGIGELDLQAEAKNQLKPVNPRRVSENLPYLVLDVRDKDVFQQCHIITAKNYPYLMLTRSCNYETKDLLAYKNSPGKLIIIYDEDETIAPRVASTLTQRGYDNLFMLSGGLKLVLQKFPRGFVVGTLSSTSQKPVRQETNISMFPSNTHKGGESHLIASSDLITKTRFTTNDLELLHMQLNSYLFPTTGSDSVGRPASSCKTIRRETEQLDSAAYSTRSRSAQFKSGKPQPWR